MKLFPWKRPPSLASLDGSAKVRTVGKRHGAADAADIAGIELLVWIGGAAAQVSEALAATLESLAAAGPETALTFLLDGPEWKRRALPLLRRFPERREIVLGRATDLPALLCSRALAEPGPDYAAFLWPGCRLDPQGLRTLLDVAAGAAGADLVHGELAAGVPPELAPPVQHAWLQIVDAIPWNGCLLARRAFQAAGPLAVSPVFQRLFGWDFTRRLARGGARILAAPAPRPAARWNWEDFPFSRPFEEDRGLLLRCLPAETGGGEEVRWADLPGDERERLCLALEAWHRGAGLAPPAALPTALPAPAEEGRWPLRVLVLGGSYEPHHNQLCFFNYFARVRGQGYLSWRAGLYSLTRPEELDGCDLVIFSRPRYPECPALLDRCRERRIASLVMIDDNWIAAGREFPRYEALFTPGKPAFEVFLDALRRATATLVYNERLEEDVRPYARHVLRMPANVEVDLFAAGPPPARPEILAGYAGSPRFEGSAFRALAAFAADHADVRLFFMAHQVPAELAGLPPERLVRLPFTPSYVEYAHTISAVRPDILLAPLDDSRFSASKCPNKFLEIAAVEAAGIYSRLLPYTRFVRDGETGLLVDNDEAAWHGALERLYRDPALRRGLAAQARREVDERYSTRTLLPVFLGKLQKVVRLAAGERQRQGPRVRRARAKVLYVSHLASLSGAEQALLRLLSHLDRSRFEPLVALPEDGPLRQRIEALNIRTRVLPIGWWIPATHWSAAEFRAQLAGLEERARALTALAEEEEVDLIHSNTVVTLEGAVAAARLGLPHVWHSRGLFGGGFPPSYFGDLGFLFAAIDGLSDAVVCVAQGVEEQAARFCQLARRPVIPDGFDAAAFLARPVGSREDLLRRYGITEPARLVASLGGIQRRKGQIDLIEALALLRDDFPDLVLVLGGGAGDAEYLAAVESRIAELGLQEAVRLVGFEPDVRTLLAHAEMLVHPSHSEGFGLAILEAMAAGRPVVATRCGGPEEIVEDGVSGLLVPVEDPPALAQAMRRLLTDAEAARALGEAAARRALDFGLDRTARRTEEVYETLLAGEVEERAARADAVMAAVLQAPAGAGV